MSKEASRGGEWGEGVVRYFRSEFDGVVGQVRERRKRTDSMLELRTLRVGKSDRELACVVAIDPEAISGADIAETRWRGDVYAGTGGRRVYRDINGRGV